MSVSREDYDRLLENQRRARSSVKPHPRPPPWKPGRPKFTRSEPADRTWGGVTYASKGEMRFAQALAKERLEHPAMWWTRQSVFDLAGVKYSCDFVVVRPWLPSVIATTCYEIKPRVSPRFQAEALRRFRRNAAQVRALWGVEVVLVET